MDVILKSMKFVKYNDETGEIVKSRSLTGAETEQVVKLLQDWSEGEGTEFISTYAKRHGYDSVEYDVSYRR